MFVFRLGNLRECRVGLVCFFLASAFGGSPCWLSLVGVVCRLQVVGFSRGCRWLFRRGLGRGCRGSEGPRLRFRPCWSSDGAGVLLLRQRLHH